MKLDVEAIDVYHIVNSSIVVTNWNRDYLPNAGDQIVIGDKSYEVAFRTFYEDFIRIWVE